MTDKAALKEIERQEKRFAVAELGRGRLFAKSAWECYDEVRTFAARRWLLPLAV